VLAVHLLWTDDGGGGFLLWGEDSDLPQSGPPRRGRNPTVPIPQPHPFTAAGSRLIEGVLDVAPTLHGAVANGSPEESRVVWLPGKPHAPLASPELIRTEAVAGSSRRAPGLWPFEVTVLRVSPSAGLDVALALGAVSSPDIHAGASVSTFAVLAALALEIAAAGRVLPDLRHDADRYEAVWEPLLNGEDDRRVRAVADSLPPVCRALTAEGVHPEEIVHHALSAFVNAVCRDSLAASRPAPIRLPRRNGDLPPAALDSWLTALGATSPVVAADPNELAKLERLVGEWRADAAARGGSFRLCLRLREPRDDGATDDVLADGGPAGDQPGQPGEGATWELEFLLQATDDLSLVVGAEEVWRAGPQLQRASRSLSAPHEVFLAELGRAVRIYPELGDALRQPAPTGLALTLDGAHRFLVEAAPALEVAGFGVLLPSWWGRPSARLGVRLKTSTPSASARGGAGTGGLLNQEGICAFDWEAALGDQQIDQAELLRLAKLKAPLVNVRGQWMEFRPAEVDRLVRFLVAQPKTRAERTMTIGEVLQVAAGVGPDQPGVPILGISAEGQLGALLRGELEGTLDVRPTPEGFVGELRPYQQRGVAWLQMLERLGLGACLADDMGLGKTATVLALLQNEHLAASAAPAPTGRGKKGAAESGPTLVICPTSVAGNWARESERFTPDLAVLMHHGATRAREAAFEKAAAAADIVITTYALATRDRTVLAKVPWRRIVLDEAQNVKNPEAKQTKAVRALPSPRKVALTGTPVENHLGELWSIMEILNPSLLGSAASFRERFVIPVERFRDEEAAEQLRRLTRPFILRRLKTDRTIVPDLPEKMEMNELCTLTKEQVTLYQAVVDDMLRRIDEADGIARKGLVLTAMLRLKQVCNHPAQFLGDGSALAGRSGKLERAGEILDEVLDSGERALVFTQFAEMGSLLVEYLSAHLGCRISYLHGGVPRRQRDDMVAEFQDPAFDVPIMVLSLKAGGTGLNLTAANHVIHFDRWWNPAVENQATDRAFRIGQRKDVLVRKLVCAGTLEDRIDQLIASKRDLAERVVGAGEGWLTELSTDDLADVLRLSAEASVGA
jgi:SNF2-related domain/SNF2 Helicase protein/Helicase conserved C-terminal domain